MTLDHLRIMNQEIAGFITELSQERNSEGSPEPPVGSRFALWGGNQLGMV